MNYDEKIVQLKMVHSNFSYPLFDVIISHPHTWAVHPI